jgi:hypothetical protein
MKDTATHYYTQVGPYVHQVNRSTGQHVIVEKVEKLPDTHRMVTDADGTRHIRRTR